jgi:drug/metabolite transporter (DMT)-like permease
MVSPTPREIGTSVSAILLILAASLIFAVSDAIAKLVVGRLPPLEVFWLRSVVVLALTLPVLLLRKGVAVLRTRHPRLQMIRGISVMGASLLFLSGLVYLPVADASAINFVWPLLITIFSVLILKETVGVRRALATVVGFIGMLVIIRPGSSAFQWAAVFPLGAALLWSFASVLTRKLSADDDAGTTLIWSAVIPVVVGSLALPFVYVQPTAWELALCGLIGIGSAMGHAMVVVAFTRAEASALAPYSYTQLVWAVAAGFLFFGTLPDAWTIAGAAIITASGVYTVHRERVRRREARGG